MCWKLKFSFRFFGLKQKMMTHVSNNFLDLCDVILNGDPIWTQSTKQKLANIRLLKIDKVSKYTFCTSQNKWAMALTLKNDQIYYVIYVLIVQIKKYVYWTF